MVDYNNTLGSRLRAVLKNSSYWQEKTRVSEERDRISRLICPACGDKEAWSYFTNPNSINCNRENKCYVRTKLRKLFPEVFKPIEEEYKPTKSEPHRPATVYLNSRGIVKALQGLNYEYHSKTRKGCGGAVMFPLGNGKGGRSVFNGRLFSPPDGEGKTHNIGSTSAMCFKHPGKKYNRLNDVYITEGIIEALSLIEMGYQAIAVLAAGQPPEKLTELTRFQNIVLAFDNDKAGHKAMKQYMAFFKDTKVNCSAILPPAGSDWNDILVQNRSGKQAVDFFKKNLPEYKFNAELALSKTAQEYAELFLEFKDYSPKLFEFGECYWFAKLNSSSKADGPPVFATKVSNFTLTVDHYSLDTSTQDEHTYRYALKVKPDGKRPVLAIFTAKDLATQSNTVAAFLHKAKCVWSGDGKAANALNLMIVESKAPTVRQLQQMGFDEETEGYYFKDFMIDPAGKMVQPNKQGIFKLPADKHVRPGQYKTLKPVAGISANKIWELVFNAWGDRGAVAFAWVFMSWFVKPIRDVLNYFPFLSLYGDSQCGKSALTRILSQSQCIDDEGLAMRKSNTSKGELRRIGQRSSLFIALIEANKGDSARIDIESILTWYDGAPLMTRAKFTSDNQTEEVPFTSSVMFVQNREPFESKPQKERVVSVEFKEEQLNKITTEAFNRLNKIPAAEFASFFPYIMQHRKRIEDNWHGAFLRAKEELAGLDISARLIGTHALVLAFHRILTTILNINYDLKPYIQEIALKKYQECNQKPVTMADVFLDTIFEYVDSCNRKGNIKYMECIDINDQECTLWFSLNSYFELATNSTLIKMPMKDLINDLKNHQAFIKTNTSHRFVEINADNTRGKSIVKKSWCFDTRELKSEIDEF